MNFADQVNALLDVPAQARKQPELSTSVVHHSNIDEYVFNDLRSRGDRFREAMATKPWIGDGPMDLAPDLWADTFKALHNAQPNARVREAADVRQDHMLFRDLLERTIDEPDFRKAKARGKGNSMMSAIQTMELQRTLTEALESTLAEAANEAERVRDAIERMESAQQDVDGWREQYEQTHDGAAEEQMQRAEQQAADARQEVEQAIEQYRTHGIMQPIGPAAEKAAENARKVGEVWASLPGTGDGDTSRIDPGKAVELARRWRDSAAMYVMSLIVGRMERSMHAARRKNVQHVREQRTGVSTGNDLSRVLTTELALRRRKPTRRLFLKRYVDRQLLQYETKGTERLGLGPQVIVVDNSGSMRKDCGGVTRFEGAAGVAMALLALGHKDKRPTYIIMVRENVVGEWAFDERTIDLEKLTDFGSREVGGGTDLTSAMRRGEQLIAKHTNFRKADVVLMTDGADKLGDEDIAIRDRLRAAGVQTHGVTIGLHSSHYTDVMCDTHVSVTDLSGPSAATDHLAVATA